MKHRFKVFTLMVAVAAALVFVATALAWHADDVSVSAECVENSYVISASIDQSDEWPNAEVISITPDSFPGNTTGEQAVVVVIGWDTGETQTFNESVELDGTCGEEEEAKVTLCHATGNSDTFPAKKYVTITVDASGAFNGHLGGGHQNGNDIIPPFEYEGQTYSQNWNDAGQAIFAAGCEVEEEEPPPTEPPPTEPPPTTPEPPVVVPPGPPCPDNPGGLPPNPPGGKDGKPGNDECIPDEVVPPIVTETTETETETTETETTETETTETVVEEEVEADVEIESSSTPAVEKKEKGTKDSAKPDKAPQAAPYTP